MIHGFINCVHCFHKFAILDNIVLGIYTYRRLGTYSWYIHKKLLFRESLNFQYTSSTYIPMHYV